jgi:cytochrome c oxidase assembly protein subunit 15
MTGRGVHAFAVLTAGATLLLIFAGGLVTSTQSGLAVPDWPLSYGMLMPPMVGGIFYEHGHRMVATGVGLLTVVLAVLLARREPRRWVRRLGAAAVATVVAQGILGGLTVRYLLPLPVSVGHACLAQAFLCLVVGIAVVTSRSWIDAPPRRLDARGGALCRLAVATTLAIYAQLVLGAITRHLSKMSIDRDGPRLAIPDFPLAFGGVVPPLDRLAQGDVAAHFGHRVGAVAVTVLVVWLASRLVAEAGLPGILRGLAVLLFAGLVVQLSLGATVVWTDKATTPTTFHVATGAMVLAASMASTLLVHRRLGPAAAPAPARGGALEAAVP